MSDLTELYQEQIREHSKKPRNFREIEGAERKLEGHNPLCGDRFTIYLKLDGDVIEDIGFKGSGCAISTASASMMTQSMKGKSRAEAEHLFERFHELLTAEGGGPDESELGKLVVFSGVRKFPVRVKCATLAWHTLNAALHGENKPVSTED
jgi:nitrogen fixation protein NifU and related proteins